MSSLTLDIFTPKGPLALPGRDGEGTRESRDLEVEGVEIPGLLGEMGVLAGHVPFITAMRPGVLRFRYDGGDVRLAVGGGFLEIAEGGRVTILAERASLPGEIDVDEVTKLRDRLRDELAHDARSIDTASTRTKRQELEWADSQLRAAHH